MVISASFLKKLNVWAVAKAASFAAVTARLEAAPFQDRAVAQNRAAYQKRAAFQNGAAFQWWLSLIGKRAKRAINVSQRTRHFARLAQILHCAKDACSG
jgi:hypothetical protein